MKNYILVDICGTLFYANTTFAFLDYIIKDRSYIIFRSIMKIKMWRYFNSIVYRIFNVDLSRKIALSFLKNYTADELNSLAFTFYDEYLSKRKIKEVWTIVADQQKLDNDIILVSGTINCIAKVVAEKINAKSYVASQLEFKNNLCTGKLQKDILKSKKDALEKIGILPNYAMCITDNFADKILLKSSEQRYVVIYSDMRRWADVDNLNYIIADEQFKVER